MGQSPNGHYQTAIGYQSLSGNQSNANTAIGGSALQNCISGTANTAIGMNAGSSIISGNFNILIGNTGLSSDNYIIRIGDSQTDTYFNSNLHAKTIVTNITNISLDSSQFYIKTNKINFSTTGLYNIYTVPSGYMFLIDTMEVITSDMSNASSAPFVSFGNTISGSVYTNNIQTTSNSQYARHIFNNPQNAIPQNTIITASITQGSTAVTHSGYLTCRGSLITQ
jgi:hypothetical protein